MIKILEVNSLDLLGRKYNGYDLISELDNKKFNIKQAVIYKSSTNNNVKEIFTDGYLRYIQEKYNDYEEPLISVKNVLSISTPALMQMNEYKEADIIHFHMFHNTFLSVFSLRKIAQEKKVVLTLHDPWFLTGRCVHFYDCDKWKKGCGKCPTLTTAFSLNKDNSKQLWNLKKQVFDNLDIDLIVPTDWLYSQIKESPILKDNKNIHKIFFGIDTNKFNKISYQDARKKLGIKDDEIVLFHRAQNEFKGTPYVLDALKKLKNNKKITVLTCDGVGLLDEVKDKYNIRDLGLLNEDELITTMNACDIFLMPSIGENAGLMAVEAMACKKPIIIFDNTGLPYVTHAPECGYLVKNRDSENLKEAINYLINNKEEREKRGKLGRKIVEEEYSLDKYLKAIEDVYQEVTKRKHDTNNDIYLENENTTQFKYYLNDITVRFFGTTSKISKKLMYHIDEKRIKNYEYDFGDMNLHELIYNYNNKLYELFMASNRKISNNVIIKIEKILYFMINNPDFIKNKIKR